MPLYEASALELAAAFVQSAYQGLLIDETGVSPDGMERVRAINDHVIAVARKGKYPLDLKAAGVSPRLDYCLDLSKLFGPKE